METVKADVTKNELKGMLRDLMNETQAEIREESEAKGREISSNPVKAQKEHAAVVQAQEEKSIDEAGGYRAWRRKDEKLLKAGCYMRCLAMANGDHIKAAQVAYHMGEKEVAGNLEKTTTKAMGEQTLAGGGALVPPVYAEEVIEYLYAKAVVSSMGPTFIPLTQGSMDMPKVTAGSTTAWIGENTNISSADMTTGLVTLREKTIAAIVPLSNKLLAHSSPSADRVIIDDLTRNLTAGLDSQLIRGLGTSYKPTGLRYAAQSANIFAATSAGASSTLAEMSTDMGKMMRLIEEGDIVIGRGGWLISPQSKFRLLTVQTTDGYFAFKDEMAGGTLFGYKWASTNQIPSNLGGGTESEVYFVDFEKILYGDGENLSIDARDGVTYFNGSANISGFSQNQTAIRGMIGVDQADKYDGKSISVLTTVKWY